MKENKDKKYLLVVGNGFDKAHNLETDYISFVNFFYKNDLPNKNYPPGFNTNPIKDQFNKNEHNLIEVVSNNKWLKIINALKNKDKDKWTDLENLIGSVLNYLLSRYISMTKKEVLETNSDFTVLKTILPSLFEYGLSRPIYIRDAISILDKDLYFLTVLLNRYLSFVQDNGKPIKIEVIESNIHEFDYFISYNYTNILEKLYGIEESSVHHVHGSLSNENSMVFGCEMNKSINGLDIFNSLVPFQKYYQRIVKKTGNLYYDWLKNKNIDSVYFYGFSFSEMDKETILRIYNNTNVLYIQYYDDSSLHGIVTNLCKYITKDELINATDEGKIVFVENMNNEKFHERIENNSFDEGLGC